MTNSGEGGGIMNGGGEGENEREERMHQLADMANIHRVALALGSISYVQSR